MVKNETQGLGGSYIKDPKTGERKLVESTEYKTSRERKTAPVKNEVEKPAKKK